MSIEEFVALIYAYSYYGKGTSYVTARDKNGNLPSAWCGKYVQAEVDKKIINTERISWSEPVTIAFAAQYLARSKGKYSYDSNNIYSFSGTENLSADDILYLSVAVDHGLISYTPGMDVSKTIPRKDLRLYEIPSCSVYAKPAFIGNQNTMRECNVYFADCYWDLDAAKKQLNILKQLDSHITMVTFQCGYINGYKISKGNKFLGCDIEHTDALSANRKYKKDPQTEAVSFCKQTGKLALLGISNASSGSFSSESVAKALSTSYNMNTTISEIISAVTKYNLDGVNMGIEISDNTYAYLRTNYSVFLQLLANELHKIGKTLVVSTGAYFTDEQEQQSIYSYSEIGAVADFVHFILYDDFNDTGFATRKTIGPISNLTRIGRCLRYGVTKMDSGKILLGIATYGVDFNLSKLTAQDISYVELAKIRQKYPNNLVFDNSNNAASAYFEYYDNSSNFHRVFFETPDTVSLRVKTAQSYNIGGYSIFHLADNYSDVFNAISSSSAYHNEVTSAISAGVLPVTIRGNYDKPITRYDFCRIVIKTIEASTKRTGEAFLRTKGLSTNKNTFYDASAREILIANALGIVTGYNDGSFRPYNNITREEAATMLTRLANILGMQRANSNLINFNELPTVQQWALPGIIFISSCVDPTSGKRVMGGTGNNNFSPQAIYTREQSAMSAFRLYNALCN